MSERLRGAIAFVLIAAVCSAPAPVAIAGAGQTPSAPESSTAASAPPAAAARPVAAALPAAAENLEASGTTPSIEPTLPPMTRREDDDPQVVFDGVWTYRNANGASGRSLRYSRVSGASARTAFSGTGVTLIGAVGPDRGRARVYVDGVAKGTADLYAPASAGGKAVWSVSGLSAKNHTVKVVVLNSRCASSTASFVYVDGFDFIGKPASVGTLPGARVQNRDKRLYRKGSWTTMARTTAFGGTTARTTQANAGYTVRFRGTGVTWFGRKDAGGGKAEVYLDGKRVAIVDQWAASAKEPRVAYSASGLGNRVHTLRIRALNAPAASGGGRATEMDAFQVRGTVLTAWRPTPFKYPWKTYIVIDKSSCRLYWVKNGWLRKSYPIAHGRNGCTPERVWRIKAKYRTSGIYGPRKMRLFKRIKTTSGYRYVFSSYGIHGTNQPWVIGTQASHGCIRMYNKDVLELFPQVPLGTMVVTRR